MAASLFYHLLCYSQNRQLHGSQLFHNLTGTIPSFHRSTEKCPIGCQWEPLVGTASGGPVSQFLGMASKEPMALWIAL